MRDELPYFTIGLSVIIGLSIVWASFPSVGS
jgi:hypothetical protein